LVVSFMIMLKLGLFTSPITLTTAQGAYILFASLPIAFVGLFSGIHQGRVAAAGISLIAKQPEEVIKGIVSAALVETYAIFALLVSLLSVIKAPFFA